jgi:hypothetical protein
MSEERDSIDSGWRVVEGPGTETTDKVTGPSGDHDLGKLPVTGSGYGASTGGVDGDPGGPGPALGELPEHDGPVVISGMEGFYSAEEEEE